MGGEIVRPESLARLHNESAVVRVYQYSLESFVYFQYTCRSDE